jgi:hypothetical protein
MADSEDYKRDTEAELERARDWARENGYTGAPLRGGLRVGLAHVLAEYAQAAFAAGQVEMRERAQELFEALNRMLVAFAGEDEELCMECGEEIGTCSSCDTCFVISKAVSAVDKFEGALPVTGETK